MTPRPLEIDKWQRRRQRLDAVLPDVCGAGIGTIGQRERFTHGWFPERTAPASVPTPPVGCWHTAVLVSSVTATRHPLSLLWTSMPVWSTNTSLASAQTRGGPQRRYRSCPSHILKGRDMAWIILVLAGLFEVGWAIGLKYTDGFSRLWPTIWTVLAMIISLWLLGIAMKSLPVGTAYSIWVGVGAVGTVSLGIVLLGEPANPARLVSVALIMAGIIGLKIATPA